MPFEATMALCNSHRLDDHSKRKVELQKDVWSDYGAIVADLSLLL
jgi:hypothetical protein